MEYQASQLVDNSFYRNRGAPLPYHTYRLCILAGKLAQKLFDHILFPDVVEAIN